jgi:hypothetical protein
MNITIDVTDVIVTVLGLIVNFILAWVAKKVVPAFQTWLHARTTEQQRQTLWNVTLELVKSAQQLYDEGLIKKPRLEYVASELEARGLTVDADKIKAAVREINLNVGQFFQTAVLGETGSDATSDGNVGAEDGQID